MSDSDDSDDSDDSVSFETAEEGEDDDEVPTECQCLKRPNLKCGICCTNFKRVLKECQDKGFI